MKTEKADVYTRITNRIVADLERGVRPWMKPWSSEKAGQRIARRTRHNASPIHCEDLCYSQLTQSGIEILKDCRMRAWLMKTQQIVPRRSRIHVGFSNVARPRTLLLVWLFPLLVPSAIAQKLTFTVIDFPGSVGSTSARGINDNGTVVGSYVSDQEHGFVYANGKFTTLDHEGDRTELTSINNKGQILLTDLDTAQQFLYSAGQFSIVGRFAAVPAGQHTICAANENLSPEVQSINGFNDNGQVAGTALFTCDKYYAIGEPIFGTPVLGNPGSPNPPDTNGTFTQFSCPNGIQFQPPQLLVTGLNDGGQGGTFPSVVGFCGSNGFVYSGGSATVLKFPGNAYGVPWGINNADQIVGQYQPTSNPDIKSGVLFDGGQTVQVLPPNATSAAALAINNRGQIAGWFSDSTGGTHGFITGATSAGSPVLIDPVSDLLFGNAITPALTISDVTAIGQPYLGDLTKGRIVEGIATDGVAQLVIRIPASSVGETFTLNIRADQCSNPADPACIDEYGLLFDPTDAPPGPTLFTDTVGQNAAIVKAVSTANGPMAFAAYRAPADFTRPEVPNDAMAATRSVYVRVTSAGGNQPDLSIPLVRPPVVYIHGLTSNPCSWNSFTPAIDDPQYSHYLLSYTEKISDRVTSVSPSYPITTFFSAIRAHVVGVAWNANNLLPDLEASIETFRKSYSFPDGCGGNSLAPKIATAAVQADVVGHSMGGLIARYFWYLPEFNSRATYGQGMIHKLITVGTPHLGSNVAKRLLDGTNQCVRSLEPFGTAVFSDATSYPFNVLVIDGISTNGAVEDLAGDGTVAGSSDLIKLLQTSALAGTPRLRMAVIAGIGTQAQFNQIDGTKNQFVTRVLCGFETMSDPFGHVVIKGPGDFLAYNFVGSLWKNVFSEDSDAFVPITSAINGRHQGDAGVYIRDGAVHGHGTVDELKFGSPHLQDILSFAPLQVETYLNTPVTRTDIFAPVP